MIYDDELKMMVAETAEEKTVYATLERSRAAVEQVRLELELQENSLAYLENKWTEMTAEAAE